MAARNRELPDAQKGLAQALLDEMTSLGTATHPDQRLAAQK